MSQAIAHFAVGASITIVLLLLTGLYTHRHAGVATIIGGFWGCLPDIHNVIPHETTTDVIQTVHHHPISDVFFFHYTMDTYDPTNSKYVAAATLLVLTVLLAVYTYAQHRTHATND